MTRVKLDAYPFAPLEDAPAPLPIMPIVFGAFSGRTPFWFLRSTVDDEPMSRIRLTCHIWLQRVYRLGEKWCQPRMTALHIYM